MQDFSFNITNFSGLDFNICFQITTGQMCDVNKGKTSSDVQRLVFTITAKQHHAQ
jgi:hypothetical protein